MRAADRAIRGNILSIRESATFPSNLTNWNRNWLFAIIKFIAAAEYVWLLLPSCASDIKIPHNVRSSIPLFRFSMLLSRELDLSTCTRVCVWHCTRCSATTVFPPYGRPGVRSIDAPRGICLPWKTEQCIRRRNCSFLTFLTCRRHRYRKVARIESTITRGTNCVCKYWECNELKPKLVTRNSTTRAARKFLPHFTTKVCTKFETNGRHL